MRTRKGGRTRCRWTVRSRRTPRPIASTAQPALRFRRPSHQAPSTRSRCSVNAHNALMNFPASVLSSLYVLCCPLLLLSPSLTLSLARALALSLLPSAPCLPSRICTQLCCCHLACELFRSQRRHSGVEDAGAAGGETRSPRRRRRGRSVSPSPWHSSAHTSPPAGSAAPRPAHAQRYQGRSRGQSRPARGGPSPRPAGGRKSGGINERRSAGKRQWTPRAFAEWLAWRQY